MGLRLAGLDGGNEGEIADLVNLLQEAGVIGVTPGRLRVSFRVDRSVLQRIRDAVRLVRVATPGLRIPNLILVRSLERRGWPGRLTEGPRADTTRFISDGTPRPSISVILPTRDLPEHLVPLGRALEQLLDQLLLGQDAADGQGEIDQGLELKPAPVAIEGVHCGSSVARQGSRT